MTEYRINPDWVKKQKRKIRWAVLYILLGFLIVFAFAAQITYVRHISIHYGAGLSFSDFSLTTRLLSIISMVGVPGFIIIFGILNYRRQKRILCLIPDHEGRVCPKCLLAMQAANTAGSLRCPKCEAEWPDEEIAKYWEQHVLPTHESAKWLAEQKQKYLINKYKLRHWPIHQSEIRAFAKRRPIVWKCIVAAIILPIYLAFGHHLFGNWYSAIIESFFFIPYIIAFALLGRGVKQRRGHEAHCASCNYLKPPQGSVNIPRCPECGHEWNLLGGTVHGTVSSNPILLIAGILFFMMISIVMPASHIPSRIAGFLSQAMPNSVLIPYVSSSGHYSDPDTWYEINNRNLTDDERNQLARLILDTRDERDYLDSDQAAWIGAQVNKNTINPSIIERYFSGMTKLWLTAPDHTVTGQAVSFNLEGRSSGGHNSHGIVVAIDLLSQDGKTIKQHADFADEWVDNFIFDTTVHTGSIVEDNKPKHFILNFTTPGKHTVQLTVWLAGVPGTGYINPIKITRKADGSPVLPPRAVWSKKVELMRTIVVSEK